jgi:hypothetical protein
MTKKNASIQIQWWFGRIMIMYFVFLKNNPIYHEDQFKINQIL